MKCNSLAWQKSVRWMRIICPIAFVVSVALTAWNYSGGHMTGAIVTAVCAGVNLILSWMQWRIFEI